MALFTRIISGVLFIVLYSLASVANSAERLGSASSVYSYSCRFQPAFRADCEDLSGGKTKYQVAADSCNASEAVDPDKRECDGPREDGDYYRWSVYICSVGYIVPEGSGQYGCYDEPEPPPECAIPSGTDNELVSQFPLGSTTCYQNCTHTNRTAGSVPWIEVNGQRMYFYTSTSTGEYCDESAGAQPSGPFDNYTDSDGCYIGFDGRYCAGGGGDCPNSVTAPDGQRYCRMPPDQEDCNEAGGSSGDAYCGQDDPNYEEPVPGDGGDDECDPETEDCSGDGGDDGGGEPGDGGGDGGSGDGDGDDEANAPGDGELVGGECTQETRKGPDCSDNMNATECAFGLQLWQARCDQKLAHEDIVGSDEYRDGDSLLSESDTNQVVNTEVDFSEALSDLDDSGSGFGGAASCPADRTINLAGFGTIKIPMTFICQWAEKIRPLIIALGWLSAGLIVLSSMRGK